MKTCMSGFKTASLGAALLLALAGCSGGGGVSSSNSTSSSTTSGTPVANATNSVITGEIQTFELSGFVMAGLNVDDTSANIVINQTSSTDSNLKNSMVFSSTGNISGTSISLGTNTMTVQGLVGVVSANSMNAIGLGGTMTVDGQTVYASPETAAVSNLDLSTSGVPVNSYLEISGYADGAGKFYATWMKVIASTYTSGDQAISGVISSLSTGATTFQIGGETVNYSSATLPGIALSDGQYVQVYSNTAPSSATTMSAASVSLINSGVHQFGPSGNPVLAEGVITSANSGSDFFLNGMEVKTSSSTKIEDLLNNTLSGSNITTGATDHDKIIVQGKVDSNNILQATLIKFGFGTYNPPKMLMVQSNMNTYSSSNTIEIAGIPIYQVQQGNVYNYIDYSAAANRDATASSFTSSDDLQEYGYEDNGHFYETMIVRTANTNTGCEGVVSTGTGGYTYAINGINLDTNTSGTIGLAIGNTVNVTGSYANGAWKVGSITNYGAL